ncbi:hypothetical protein M011DRAFT_468095 [Sporormia fimetaria CBS 119925]|uniref:Uncharacterized protein n=1 Tax=Sporormia fimetaria CBS 119925 TaxID=1340428 RepID=A0A6A6V9N3_9PLEO|nr:hypothetical protein M011DRAFT_468095 [Sporormia fimetaria CBS 119925]
MVRLSFSHLSILFLIVGLIPHYASSQMIGSYRNPNTLRARQNRNQNNGNNNNPDTSAFNIENGRILTPGLAIILAPQPFTPMGGDFLHIALDVSGDGKLPVPPRTLSDPLTQVFNFTLFLTSIPLAKNFTISNITTTTPPFADIMDQELGQTVKHINFEWPSCLVGDGRETISATARGDYNISIHQNYRLNGVDYYSIFNLPISVTNGIAQFPGADQLVTVPPPGPLSANGGRVPCEAIENPMMGFAQLVESVSNPPGQPFQDIAIETTERRDGGQVGEPGTASGNEDGDIGVQSEGDGGIGGGDRMFRQGGAQDAVGSAAGQERAGYWGAWICAAFAVGILWAPASL